MFYKLGCPHPFSYVKELNVLSETNKELGKLYFEQKYNKIARKLTNRYCKANTFLCPSL